MARKSSVIKFVPGAPCWYHERQKTWDYHTYDVCNTCMEKYSRRLQILTTSGKEVFNGWLPPSDGTMFVELLWRSRSIKFKGDTSDMTVSGLRWYDILLFRLRYFFNWSFFFQHKLS